MSCSMTSQPRPSAYANATTAFGESAKVNPALPSPQLPMLCPMPTMRSKPASNAAASVSPDFAGMRHRRDAGCPSIRQLQQRAGITRPEAPLNPHEEVLEAYGYQQLVDGLFALPQAGLNALRKLGDWLPQLQIGPRGCEARPLPTSSLDDLIDKFGTDVEHWISPAARNATDARGLLIVLGNPWKIPSLSKKLQSKLFGEFQEARGDQIYISTVDKFNNICGLYEEIFRLPKDSCRHLGTAPELMDQLESLGTRAGLVLEKRFDYIESHMPGALQRPVILKEARTIADYFHRWEPLLPATFRPGYDKLKRQYDELREQRDKLMKETYPRRNQYIADLLKSDMGSGWNMVVVEPAYLHDLRHKLSDEPCVFLMPKMITDAEPELSLHRTFRDEL